MPTNSARPPKLLGFEAELQTTTVASRVYALYRRHTLRQSSLMGWVDIHYPCHGKHQLCIRACLDPKLTKFASHTNFGGVPSRTTAKLLTRLLADVRALIDAPDDCTWRIDLQDRGIGTYESDPSIGI